MVARFPCTPAAMRRARFGILPVCRSGRMTFQSAASQPMSKTRGLVWGTPTWLDGSDASDRSDRIKVLFRLGDSCARSAGRVHPESVRQERAAREEKVQ